MRLALALTLALQPAPATVEVSGERWRELSDTVEVDGAAVQVPWATSRHVEIERVEAGGPGRPEGLIVRGRWRLRAQQPSWFLGRLIGAGPVQVESASWNGQPATIAHTPIGTLIAGHVEREAELTMVAFVAGDPTRAPVILKLLPAVQGDVWVRADGVVPEILAGDARVVAPRVGPRIWLGDERVELRLAAPKIADGGTLAIARVGVGVTVGDQVARGRARVRWEVRRGQLEVLTLATHGLGDDLEVKGAGVRSWRRAEGRVEVTLQEPVRDRVELELTWTRALSQAAEATMELPRVTPDGAFRVQSAAQLARDGEVEVLPKLTGWDAVAAAELPEWGQGLVEGTPTAAFRTAGLGAGSLELLRYVPVAGPPAVVDVAAYSIATSREGRTLTRAHYEIRNERAAFLRIEPPPGSRILGARVAGETALPARGRGGAWLIPLRRSVESVGGLISFPVEVALLGRGPAWSRRERRALRLPKVDAPVAVSRVTLYLPPDYASKLDEGEHDVVDAFTRGQGITYGLGLGTGAAEADARFQSAVRSWLNNDFEAAQRELDALQQMGARNENVDRLQANLYVIEGHGPAAGEDRTLERRVKDQAQARASADRLRQVESRRRAQDLQRAGEFDEAKEEYRAALELGRELERLEQSESVEQQKTNVALEQELEQLEQQSDRKGYAKRKDKARKARPSFGSVASKSQRVPAGATLEEGAGGGDTDDIGGSYKVSGANATTPPTDKIDANGPPAQPPEPKPAPEPASLVDTVTETVDAPAKPEPTRITARRAEVRSEVSALPGATKKRKRARRWARKNDAKQRGPSKDPAPPDRDADGLADRLDAAAPEDVNGLKDEDGLEEPRSARTQQLPPPKTTASALSVVIPAAGEAVLYQRLLLEPSATFEVRVDAREHRRKKKRDKR
ncbi:MAG: hypothetical protein KC636_14215 [Myxococcales bacterium]|nr:hypothetical protein [Myxococcales bacterium]